ncbi:MAG: multidrug ABC transporter permease [Bacteroidetes bacterium 4572_77]|nr:MAG: multidrug ABC transporter permease [Bacteroidetes bacterium 4572_77]
MKIFIIKEFLQIIRDSRSLVILFGIPIMQVLLFGFALESEMKNVHLAILDQSKDAHSQELSRKMTASGYFILDENLTNTHQIEEVFKKGKVKEVLVFPEHFGEDLEKNASTKVQIITDASDPNSANVVYAYSQAIINSYMMELNRATEQPVRISIQNQMRYNPQLKSVFMFVPGIITIILMLVSAMMTSISITREKELGTMEVLLVSPVKPWQIILGKVIPYITLSFVSALIILLISYFVFEMPFNGSILLLLSETILFIILALSLGVFISTVSKTQQVAMLMSMFALLLPTILLSGFIFPIKNMPEILIWTSHILPAKWFVIIIKNIMIKGNGLDLVWRETLILIGMTLVFVSLSIKKFKIRLE